MANSSIKHGFYNSGVMLGVHGFEQLRQIIYQASGIHLKDAKRQMVQSRLTPRLRHLGLHDFDDYISHLASNPEEMTHMLNRITTNKTSFFREPKHFKILQERVLNNLAQHTPHGHLRTVNGWCAASSTGEEPYTLAMVLARFMEQHPGWSARLLASDLDTNVLATAKRARYVRGVHSSIPQPLATAYTAPCPDDPEMFQIISKAQRLVQFRQINLMQERYPIRSALDFIFCRNVFIYFTRADRDNVIRRFIQLLKPGGYLFIGHSEVLELSTFKGQLEFIGDTTYQKLGG